jgi:hypothetical protein
VEKTDTYEQLKYCTENEKSLQLYSAIKTDPGAESKLGQVLETKGMLRPSAANWPARKQYNESTKSSHDHAHPEKNKKSRSISS